MQFPDSIPPVTPSAQGVHPFSDAPPEDPSWNLLHVLLIAIFGLVSLVVGLKVTLSVVHSLPHFRGMSLPALSENVFIAVPAQIFAYALLLAFMVLLVRSKTNGSFLDAVSWNEPGFERTLIALLGGAGLAIFSSIFSALFSRWIPKSLPVDKLFHDAGSAYLLSAFGVIVAPFMEELFFRGFLYPALARRLGVAPSVVLTAAGFAVVHQVQLAHAWVPLAWLFIVGVVLTVVRARTKSVATCILVHVAYNTTLFLFLFLATQGFHHMERA